MVAASLLAIAAGCSSDDAEGAEGADDTAGGSIADSSGTDSSDTDGAGDGPRCRASDATMELLGVDVGETMSHEVPTVMSILGDGSVLLRSYDTDGAAHLSFVRPGVDSSNVEIAAIPDAYAWGLEAAALSFSGKRCALYFRAGQTLKFVCEGSPPEDSGVVLESTGSFNPGPGIVPLVLPDGSIEVYGQGEFASYDGAARDATGAWQEVEKSESSISWADDAVLHDGQPVACFIDAGGYPVLDVDGEKIRLERKSNRCRMLATASTLHLLVDDGHVPLAWGNLAAAGAPTPVDLGTSAPGPMLLLGDTAYVIVDRGSHVEAVPLAEGAPFDLGVDGSLAAMHVDGTSFRGATSIPISSNSGPYTAEIRLATRCLDE